VFKVTAPQIVQEQTKKKL